MIAGIRAFSVYFYFIYATICWISKFNILPKPAITFKNVINLPGLFSSYKIHVCACVCVCVCIRNFEGTMSSVLIGWFSHIFILTLGFKVKSQLNNYCFRCSLLSFPWGPHNIFFWILFINLTCGNVYAFKHPTRDFIFILTLLVLETSSLLPHTVK